MNRYFGSALARGSETPAVSIQLHRSALAGLMMVVALLPGAVWAQNTAVPTGIAVIDTERATIQSEAYKSFKAYVDQIRTEDIQVLRPMEAELMAEKEKLEAQRNILSQEAFAQQVQAHNDRFTEYKRENDARRKRYEQMFASGQQQIQGKMVEILMGLAQEREFHLILNWERADTMVIFASPALDVTDEVIGILNERLPQVEIVEPQLQ